MPRSSQPPPEEIVEFRVTATNNKKIISHIVYVSSDEYQELYKALTCHKSSLGRKLLNILTMLEEYGEKPEQKISYNKKRGIEALFSLEYLRNAFGSALDVWGRAITRLCAMNLLKRYIPRPERKSNTPEQEYSIKVSNRKGYFYTQRWYSLQPYTDELLREADEIAKKLNKGTSHITRTSIKNALGGRKANKVFDSKANKEVSKKIEKQRQMIFKTAKKLIKDNGYTTKAKIIEEAYKALTGKGNSLRHVRETYEAYAETMYTKLSLTRPSRPTKTEKEKYSIQGDKYIIRKRGGCV